MPAEGLAHVQGVGGKTLFFIPDRPLKIQQDTKNRRHSAATELYAVIVISVRPSYIHRMQRIHVHSVLPPRRRPLPEEAGQVSAPPLPHPHTR